MWYGLRMGVPIPDILKSSSMTLPYFDLFGLAVGLVSKTGTLIGGPRPCRLANVELKR
jgi:hypothetical protein